MNEGDQPLDEGLLRDSSGQIRCLWGASHADYIPYHDGEWGRPVDDDRRLFEKICLEGFQSGLSWLTILRKRENFRAAFANFEMDRVAEFGPDDIERLVTDEGIIRHRGKIVSAINNAARARLLRDEFGSLAAYFWRFEPGGDERPERIDLAFLRANPVTPSSTRLAKDLKKRGWSFVGPTTCYALMQAMGMVNDHIEGCFCRAEAEAARARFIRPV